MSFNGYLSLDLGKSENITNDYKDSVKYVERLAKELDFKLEW